MRKISSIKAIHFSIWLLSSMGYFFASELITKFLFSGFDNVQLWLVVLVIGLFLILILTIISFYISKFLSFRQKVKR